MKQVILFLVCLFIQSNLFSQPTFESSTEAYDYWAKRGTIEMVYAYLQDYLATVDVNKFSKENKSTKDYFTKFVANIELKSQSEIDTDYQSVNKFLMDNFGVGAPTKLFTQLKSNYNHGKQIDDNFFIINTSRNNNANWISRKKSILNSYKMEIMKYEIDFMGFMYYFFYCFGGIILGGFLIYRYSKKKIYSILSEEKYKYIKDLQNFNESFLFNYIGLFAVLKKSKDDYKYKANDQGSNSQIPQLNRLIEELNAEIIKLQNRNLQLEKLNRNTEAKSMEAKPIETSTNEEVLVINTKYFTIPESDGSFKIANGRNSNETDCFYKIEVDKNNQKGKLFYISSDYDLKALDNIDYYLKPVCEFENITDRLQAKRITQINCGIVLLSGDNWKIESNNKVKIRLI